VLVNKVHLWAFDPTGGDSINPIKEPLCAHPVRVVDGRIEVDPDPTK
jgi:nitrite reductase/ring-hydroxylating ferredoxin subunit